MLEASSIEEDEGESEGAFGEGFGSWTGWTFLERREEDFAMIWKLFCEGGGEEFGNGSVNRSVVKNQPWPNAAFRFGWTQLKYDLFVSVFHVILQSSQILFQGWVIPLNLGTLGANQKKCYSQSPGFLDLLVSCLFDVESTTR